MLSTARALWLSSALLYSGLSAPTAENCAAGRGQSPEGEAVEALNVLQRGIQRGQTTALEKGGDAAAGDAEEVPLEPDPMRQGVAGPSSHERSTQELPPPLYARSRRCRRVAHTFLGAEAATLRICLEKASSEIDCGQFVMFSGSSPHWGCHCCDYSGPDWDDYDSHHWDVYTIPQNRSTLETPRPRLHMLAITYNGSVELAETVEKSLRRRMSPLDRLTYVCGTSCARFAEGKLKDVLEMPDWELDSLAVHSDCLTDRDRPRAVCSYRLASMKFVFGLIKEVERMLATGFPMPMWWLVQDDDTYVHVENLMAAVNGTAKGKPLWQTKVSYGRSAPGCPGICGGQGWLLSAAAAEALVKDHGKHLIHAMEDSTIHGAGYYDVYVPEILRWAGVELLDLTAMNDCNLNMERVVPLLPAGASQKNGPICWEKPYCPCSRSPNPATWHMKGGGTLEQFDAEP